jgi:Concanavalin A-like lectin/glucanases superfamily
MPQANGDPRSGFGIRRPMVLPSAPEGSSPRFAPEGAAGTAGTEKEPAGAAGPVEGPATVLDAGKPIAAPAGAAGGAGPVPPPAERPSGSTPTGNPPSGHGPSGEGPFGGGSSGGGPGGEEPNSEEPAGHDADHRFGVLHGRRSRGIGAPIAVAAAVTGVVLVGVSLVVNGTPKHDLSLSAPQDIGKQTPLRTKGVTSGRPSSSSSPLVPLTAPADQDAWPVAAASPVHSDTPTHPGQAGVPVQPGVDTQSTKAQTQAPQSPQRRPAIPLSGPHALDTWPLGSASGLQWLDSTGAHQSVPIDIGKCSGHGGCTTFNGKSSKVYTHGAVLNTAAGHSFTVSAWAYLTNNGHDATVLSQDAVQNSGFYLQYYQPGNRWSFSRVVSDVKNAPGVRALSDGAPRLNTWTHLVGVYDASDGQLRLFVNGRETSIAHYASPFAATGDFEVGRAKFNNEQVDYFPGDINDVKVYSSALDATQVKAL